LRGGRLTLIKSVIEAILVYWMSLFLIPKYVIEKIKKLSLNFLWSRDREKRGITLVKWKRVALPKDMGGWGIKYLSLFAKALSAKCVWRLITVDGLWSQVMKQKYIELDFMEDWIRSPTKSHQNALIVWKVVILAFPLVGRWLIWKVGRGNKVRLGEDPWVGYGVSYRLSENLVQIIRVKGYYKLCQVVDRDLTTIWKHEWKDVGIIGLEGNEAT
jgi:hypothetical protein